MRRSQDGTVQHSFVRKLRPSGIDAAANTSNFMTPSAWRSIRRQWHSVGPSGCGARVTASTFSTRLVLMSTTTLPTTGWPPSTRTMSPSSISTAHIGKLRSPRRSAEFTRRTVRERVKPTSEPKPPLVGDEAFVSSKDTTKLSTLLTKLSFAIKLGDLGTSFNSCAGVATCDDAPLTLNVVPPKTPLPDSSDRIPLCRDVAPGARKCRSACRWCSRCMSRSLLWLPGRTRSDAISSTDGGTLQPFLMRLTSNAVEGLWSSTGLFSRSTPPDLGTVTTRGRGAMTGSGAFKEIFCLLAADRQPLPLSSAIGVDLSRLNSGDDVDIHM
eukprot:PhM_4_TR15624/c3_g1_i3/m.10697